MGDSGISYHALIAGLSGIWSEGVRFSSRGDFFDLLTRSPILSPFKLQPSSPDEPQQLTSGAASSGTTFINCLRLSCHSFVHDWTERFSVFSSVSSKWRNSAHHERRELPLFTISPLSFRFLNVPIARLEILDGASPAHSPTA